LAPAALIVTRRTAILSAAALAACGPRKTGGKPAPDKPTTIEAAVAGAWRVPADRARDPWRHPAQSLTFWGLKPGQTVVEFWPGSGWYTDILAPFLAATGGKLYAASLQVSEPADVAARETVNAYRRHLESHGRVHSGEEWRRFSEERLRAKYMRAKCC